MKNKIELNYYRPNLSKRLFSRIVDGIILLFLSGILYLSIGAIYKCIPEYNNAYNTLEEIRLNSNLYVKSNNKTVNVSTYIYNDEKMSDSQKEAYLLEHLNGFFEYMKSYNEESYLKVINNYDNFRLSSSLTYNSYPLFIKNEDGSIDKNTSINIPISTYIDKCYTVYIDTNCNGFLNSEVKEYLTLNKYLSMMNFYINIPISVFIASILTYFIPPLIFKRGRKTLGMLLYRIGFVNKDLYNLTFKEYIKKFLLFYFSEFLLSFLTFGIPLIISLTMMLITKNKQTFDEYMLNIQEVSTYDSTIYYDKNEILIHEVNDNEHVDFKLR